jgi:hypothetical protein
MSILLNGSICLSDLIAQAKLQHSAFSKSEKNGKIYVNITQWVNDEPDKYENHSSFQLNSTSDENRVKEGKIYFGNAKKMEAKVSAPISNTDTNDLPEDSDLPF